MAQRQGFVVSKSRARDPFALTFGKFAIVDPETDEFVFGEYDLSLDDVEAWLTRPRHAGRRK
jgi:hypothetical protein